jgi:hypothetical protein
MLIIAIMSIMHVVIYDAYYSDCSSYYIMHIMLNLGFGVFAVLRGVAVQRLPSRILQVIQTKTKPLKTILSNSGKSIMHL